MMTARRSKRAAARTSATPTREVILDTAERLFAERGVDGVALRDLARAMNLTAPSLYNHFPSKQALYEAVLERGLRPILTAVVGSRHPGALRPDQIGATVQALVTHFTTHPYMARLVQRALLDESVSVRRLVARWLTPLYGEGVAVVGEAANETGWNAEEVPQLALGLFGMVFAYFTNAAALANLDARGDDPMAPPALAVQRRVLEKAIYRLLGPQPATGAGTEQH